MKLGVAGLLIGWLVRSGHLDVHALRLYLDRPLLLLAAMGLFFTGQMTASTRFRILLRIADVRLSAGLALRLQLTAAFFNTVIPGSVGGDVVKALYVARDEPPEKRTTILLLVFVERLLGLIALVVSGMLIVLARGTALFDDARLRPLAVAVCTLGAATVLGAGLGFLLVRALGPRLEAFTSGPSKLSKLLNQLVSAMRLVSQGPKPMAGAFVLSAGFHMLGALLFTVITRSILDRPVPYSSVATIFPLGLLTLVVPIAPAGLGVGHVVFERLFEAIGLPHGATIFNVYLLGQLAPCLLGVIPFLSLRKKLPAE